MVTKAEIQFVRSLADRRARQESGAFVVEGPKMVAEALASGWTVRKVYGCATFAGTAACFEHATTQEMERMSSLRTPQGMLAVVEMPHGDAIDAPEYTEQDGLVLALDGIQDPGNLGTIMRTADWFGIRRMLCSPDTADCFNPKAVQASMGAIFRVAATYGELTFPTGATICGAMLDGEDIYSATLDPAAIIVMGNEGNGISPAVATRLTHRLRIPSFPVGGSTSESLNVAAATAIICSEFRRRLR